MDHSDILNTVGSFLAATIMGGIIGIEREREQKPAGCRTYMLIAGSAAIFVGMGSSLVADFRAAGHDDMIKTDPIRLVQAIIMGLGFIGGGLTQQKDVKGHNLSTASAFLMAAGIGIYCGLHKYAIATTLTLLTVTILHVLGKIEQKMEKKEQREQEK